MAERLWQMRRLGSGDYLLLSNDRETLWRIQRYDERDGTLTRGDGKVINGTFWRLCSFAHPVEELTVEMIDWPWSTDNWPEAGCMFPTRQAAVDYALEREFASHQGSSPAPHHPVSTGGAGQQS